MQIRTQRSRASATPAPAPALTEIVLTSPDPDDLTLRQLRLLNQADTIYHAADVPPAVLDRARRDAVRVAGAVPAAFLPEGRTVVLRYP
jgi:uroporphyrin-III C-methyltransferase/precorrin-2 dehydrogenase/sirohydrochlorin ferrochelatase